MHQDIIDVDVLTSIFVLPTTFEYQSKVEETVSKKHAVEFVLMNAKYKTHCVDFGVSDYLNLRDNLISTKSPPTGFYFLKLGRWDATFFNKLSDTFIGNDLQYHLLEDLTAALPRIEEMYYHLDETSDFHFNLARFYYERGYTEKSRPLFEVYLQPSRMINQDMTFLSLVYYNLALIAKESEEFKVGRDYLLKANAMMPGDAHTLEMLEEMEDAILQEEEE